MGKIVASLAVVLPILLTGWVVVNSRDLPEADDADLVVARVPDLPPDQNAYPALLAAALACGEPADAHEALKQRADLGRLAPLLAQHAEALAAIRPALARPHFQIAPSELEELDTEPLQAFSLLARLLTARAALHAGAGDAAAALADVELALALGEALQRATGARLTHGVLAVITHEIALEELERQLALQPLPAHRARELAARLEKARLASEAWRAIFAVEYEGMKAAMAPVIAEAQAPFERTGIEWLRYVPASYVFHPNRTLSAFAAGYRQLGERAASGCATRLIDEEKPFSSWNYVAPNSIGRILTQISQPDLDRYHQRACIAGARLSAAQARAALHAYAAEHGQLPAALGALVPRFLTALPADPYSGAPLRYSRDAKRLWSVGIDGVDAGGRDAQGEAPQADEPTFAIRL